MIEFFDVYLDRGAVRRILPAGTPTAYVGFDVLRHLPLTRAERAGLLDGRATISGPDAEGTCYISWRTGCGPRGEGN